MISGVQPAFVNRQKDTLQNAVIKITKAFYTEVAQEKVDVQIEFGAPQERTATEPKRESVIESVRFEAEYWTNPQNQQQGRPGYLLEGIGGEIEFIIDIDEEWSKLFNEYPQEGNAKIQRLCEEYLKEIVLPELRAS